MEQWILFQEKKRSKEFASEIDELDKEAVRLADRLEEHMTDKWRRDFEIRLFRGALEKRKTYPRVVPPSPSQKELQEQREREAEKERKDVEFRLKCQREFERQPFQLYLKDQKANLARDPEFYWRDPPTAAILDNLGEEGAGRSTRCVAQALWRRIARDHDLL
jgi:hypothetical protein